MAHFAKLEDGIVTQVIVVSDTDAPDPAPENSEPAGQAFIRDVLKLDGEWKQTSYNKSFRYNFAGPGYTYDADADAWIAPQPFPSWVVDTTTYRWVAPIPAPADADTVLYDWDEDGQAWVAVPLPVEDDTVQE